ncbi:T9SS type A sorting domain-containing protein [Flavobacterium sp. 245]|uniref:T9SS type A sorting domain-containing protein n=1 Tax=Flavobacterium sp. 245 TaxID=2512115 RepID=UPI00105F471D|nr:T9SS type A sorting domain-containing protein [Flavobacterium sp. 245]TDP03042.1 putative repeat protein (TIGR01451 family)/predicted secreted protein (Por secretion system target) [Flavobacterium sp. 245]
MIKNYLLLLTLCIFSSVNSQIINIPDAKFKAKLLEADVVNDIAKDNNQNNIKIDSNGDGVIQENEALEVRFLKIPFSDISSLDGIKKFTNLWNLQCSQNQLTSLDLSNLPNLVSVSCYDNKLTSINLNGCTKMLDINCSNNSLTSLDLTGLNRIDKIECYNNLIEDLDVSNLADLVFLFCESNRLKKLDLTGNPKLINLRCANNEISNLDLLGLKLVHLNVSGNKLSALNLDDKVELETLRFENNPLLNIDLGKLNMPNLDFLECGNTGITKFDISKFKKLTMLSCPSLNLEELDLTNLNFIEYLICSSNKFKKLDVSNLSNLKSFNFDWNPLLETVFMKNGSIENEIFMNETPNLKYICADDDQLSEVQSILSSYNYNNCLVNSYCFFEPGGESYSIQLTNRNDLNNNGCDALDIPASFLKFKIDNGIKSGNFISNEAGKYDAKVVAGNYKVTPIFENPSYFSISPASMEVEFPTVSSPFLQDFCVKAIGIHNDLEVTFLPIWPSRPGFAARYKIVYKNKGNVAQSGTLSLAFDDAVLDLTGSNPSVSTTASNKISWDFTNLKPFESRQILLNFDVNSPIETPPVNNGDILSYTAAITSSVVDETSLDNTFVYNETVVGSYDPNDKICLEGNVITPTLIGEYVHYMIRFENTGTYMAQNIVVKDMIDLSKFDISTLVPTSASHSYTTKISDGNKVEFIFENINLPFNNVNRNGYIAFKIKTLPTLKKGDTFENEANIYFDYNFPILTNKATSTFKALGRQDFEFSEYFNIYPNPVQDILNIDSKNTIQKKSMQIFDVLGQTIISVLNAENVSKIDVSKLQSGNYILKISSDRGSSSFKFIKR